MCKYDGKHWLDISCASVFEEMALTLIKYPCASSFSVFLAPLLSFSIRSHSSSTGLMAMTLGFVPNVLGSIPPSCSRFSPLYGM